MDTKRLVIFIVFSISIIYLWQMWLEQNAPPVAAVSTSTGAQPQMVDGATAAAPADDGTQKLHSGDRIRVVTDVLNVELDTVGGDIRQAILPKYGANQNPSKPFQLLDEGRQHVYITQAGLLGEGLPDHEFRFAKPVGDFRLKDGQDKLSVDFRAVTASGVEVIKHVRFSRGSYLVNIDYEIINRSPVALKPSAYFRLVRDGKSPELESKMASKFTGPAVFTDQDKFHTLAFDDVADGSATYNKRPDNGWVGMVQHYFAAAWLLNQPPAADGAVRSVCKPNGCDVTIKKREKSLLVKGQSYDDLYSVTVTVGGGEIAPGQSRTIGLPLFIGPQDSNVFAASPISDLAPELELTKDYGWVTFLAAPLFWVLQQIQKVISNWGWAIVALTVVIKAVLYPLSAAGYKSMANMKKMAPKLQAIKESCGDDKMKYQQAMMELYKTEKINPLGGCLPILVQIPVFFALYSVLLSAVELRQAPFMLWINDLSSPDPYFVLPVLMAVTMYLQTFLNPPPTDPMQAKMMKFMPIAFSVMFFFFPVGLVIYYLVNNLLSMLQQWYVNTKYGV